MGVVEAIGRVPAHDHESGEAAGSERELTEHALDDHDHLVVRVADQLSDRWGDALDAVHEDASCPTCTERGIAEAMWEEDAEDERDER
jgi:hypothetical protein